LADIVTPGFNAFCGDVWMRKPSSRYTFLSVAMQTDIHGDYTNGFFAYLSAVGSDSFSRVQCSVQLPRSTTYETAYD
jgi:hypothetical protein